MQDKFLKLFTSFALILSLNSAMCAEEQLQIVVKKADIQQDERGGGPKIKKEPISFLLNGMRQALTSELVKNSLTPENFWKKIEEQNFNEADEINFFRPYFIRFNIVMEKPSSPAPSQKNDSGVIPAPTVDQFQRATFSYEFDPAKIKSFFIETITGFPDVSTKIFYILPEVNISQEMTWPDVGVEKQENFTGVIIDSWKKWALTNFKNFSRVVVLEKDFIEKSDNFNSESVTLKWNSTIKKSETFQDRKSARFEVSAQFVLVNTKSSQSLVAFDFPLQKREVGISNTRDLSSNLASLVFNLLNSQTGKISSALEFNRATSALTNVDIKITGKHGLLDITQLNTLLSGLFKDFNLSSEMKSYSMDESVISIKSTMNEKSLYEILSKNGGKFPLNEQKLLLFSTENKSFAIISKEVNN